MAGGGLLQRNDDILAQMHPGAIAVCPHGGGVDAGQGKDTGRTHRSAGGYGPINSSCASVSCTRVTQRDPPGRIPP